jgi:hypothetical protein
MDKKIAIAIGKHGCIEIKPIENGEGFLLLVQEDQDSNWPSIACVSLSSEGLAYLHEKIRDLRDQEVLDSCKKTNRHN